MKKPILILILIIFLALAFRIPAVLNSKSFWFDEVVSLEIAKKGIVDSWQYLKWENNPPGHYWFLHFWIKLFGTKEIALRFSSVLFGILSILAIYILGKKLVNQKVGLFAAFLIAISSYQIFLSMDARMYQMLLTFGILSCYYFWQTLYNPKKIHWFLYVVFTLLAFYTHLTGLFLFLSQNLYWLYHYFYLKKNKPSWLNWLLGQIVILILFLPWLISFLITHLPRFNSGAWYLHTSGGGFLLFQLPRSFLFLGDKMPFIELIALIIFGILFILSLVKIYDWSLINKEFKVHFRLTPQIIFLLTIFLIPLLAGFFLQLWVSKYYLIGSFPLYLIFAIGFNNLNLNKKYKMAFCFLIFLMILPYANFVIKNQGQHQWQNLAKYVESQEQASDKILIPAFVYELPFSHYYKGNLKIVGYGPQGLENDLLLKTVKYNWYPVLNKDNMPDINQILENNKRVIVINPSIAALIHNANLVLDWFVENNWHLVHKEQFGGFIQPTVFIFERPF